MGWLASIGRAVCAALAAGAVRIADTDGGLTLVRPDGRHLAVAPHIVEQLAKAGLLPLLPEPVVEPGVDDPVDRAERAEADRRQAEMVRGLLAAAAQRPPCFPGEASRPPPPGAHCSACRGRRWWFPARPARDGTTPSPHWRCAACRPPDHPGPGDRVEMRA